MDALTLLLLLFGFGETTSDAGDPGSGDPNDPGRGGTPIGG